MKLLDRLKNSEKLRRVSLILTPLLKLLTMADKRNGHIKTSLGSQDFTIISGKESHSDSIPKTNHAILTKWRQNKERQGTMSNKLEMTVYTNCTSFLF